VNNMTYRDISVTGNAFVAHHQHIYLGDEFVKVSPVPVGDLEASAEGRFADPGGEWATADEKLLDNGVVILRGPRGSGRRTAALRLLSKVCEPEQLFYLSPQWEQPSLTLLQPPVQPDHGYILDMTEPTEKAPGDDFGSGLLHQVEQGAIHLVVLATEETWSGEWTAGARDAEVIFRSPDARQFVARELAISAPHRLSLLDAPEFADIWDSHPRAADARRLAGLIADPADRTPEEIADEYGDWHAWIDRALPPALDPRAIMWSSAFCDGGSRKSVLKMADGLRVLLGETRTGKEILLDPPASKRLEAATIKPTGDVVRLAPDRHGLARAVCHHLWEEYESQRDLITRWLTGQVAILDVEDARRVVRAMLDLAIRYRDDKLLAGLRDNVTGKRRPLAVEAFESAILDPRSGAYMRNRLYAWLKNSPSRDFIEVFAVICTGKFGEQEPDMALTRLRLAALRAQPGSQALADAFLTMAVRHPVTVLAAVAAWYSRPSSLMAGINAFLAIASTTEGARLLTVEAARADGFTATVIRYFHRALAESVSREAALRAITSWGEAAQNEQLDEELAITLLGGALVPVLRDNVMDRFPGALNLSTFWGRVFEAAIIHAARANGTAAVEHVH
jgi:hypothetical protein